METVVLWEKIMYISALFAFVAPLLVLIFAGKWIKNTYFSKKNGGHYE